MLSAIRPIKLFLTIQHGLCVVAAQTVVARAGTKPPRRFPPPWTVEELDDACFVVSDSANHASEECVQSALLTRRSVRLRCFGSPFHNCFEFRTGPSPSSADIGNGACRRSCH